MDCCPNSAVGATIAVYLPYSCRRLCDLIKIINLARTYLRFRPINVFLFAGRVAGRARQRLLDSYCF
jgi:hypothetical protein